jgi:ribosomal protein S18 acetylase RimI-like enzyme
LCEAIQGRRTPSEAQAASNPGVAGHRAIFPYPLRLGSQVRYSIEPASLNHLPGMVWLFQESFPDSPFTVLGRSFLEEVVASYVAEPGACAYVCLLGGSDEVAGLILGSEDSSRHRRLLFSHHRARMLLKAARGLAGSSRAFAKFLRFAASFLPARRGTDWVVSVRGQGNIPPASLTFLAVSEQHRRRGIAGQLTEQFLREMRSRGIERLKLAVAADNEPALAFYLSRGWRISARVSASNRVEAYRLTYEAPPSPQRRTGAR